MTLSLCLCSSHGTREGCSAKRATSSRAEPVRSAPVAASPASIHPPNAITIVITLVGNAWWEVTASIDILPAVRGLPPLSERALPLPLGTGQQTRPCAPFAYVLSYADSSLRVNAPVEPEVIASSIVRLHSGVLHRKVFPRC